MSNGGLCGDPIYGVPPCHEKTVSVLKRKKAILRFVFIFLGISVLVFVLALSYILERYRKKNKTETPADISLNTTPLRVPYHELLRATKGYNESHLLGTGSYGSVYKARLQNGDDVAVKVFNLKSEGGFKSFDTECEVLRKLRHRNLCKVIGSCSNEEFKALVLEYMPNGSLEKLLYLENNYLNMVQRLKIMIDVACALEYLHHDYSTPIVHCDLKPSNVLLDDDMVAHLSDFGIAKLLSDGEFSNHLQFPDQPH
ncbi:receptor kinase-like protein Xa21 [Henckelia pumila]|uniref:receptor kinase-like protein Xa21 n=1 Tax=Henckelia pumila TaxID=405737 RepID=UPI003C6EA119